MSEHQEDFDDDQINEQAIVNAILDLGNDILKNLGVEERIDDVGVFFGDAFYIQFFEVAFPDIDFSQLQEAETEEDMAANIQTLIDLLGSEILKYDLSHIKGEEIVSGNPEHCINLLQLVQEIASMLDGKPGDSEDGSMPEEGKPSQKETTSKKQSRFMDQEEEDDEAQLLYERRQKQQQQQQQVVSPPKQGGPQAQSSAKQTSNKRGRSYSDDKTGNNKFNLDDMDISNEFDVNMDEDLDEEEMMMLMNQQRQASGDKSKEKSNQKQQIIDNYQENPDDEEIDEDDLKMYEQFLANNKQQEQQLAMLVDEDQPEPRSAPGPNGGGEEDDDEEIDLDNIDYDDLDPQILELAEQMGVHPKEVIKQMLKMQQEGYGDEDGEEGEEDEEELMYQQQLQQQQQKQQKQQQQQQQQQQQLQQQQQMKQQQQLQYQQQQQQQQRMKEEQKFQQQQQQQRQSSQKKGQDRSRVKPLPHELIQQDSDEESYYSEGELISRDKVVNKKNYSAPYIIMNYCFNEPLYDSEEEYEERANSTTILDNLQDQQALAQAMAAQAQDGSEEEMDEETAQMIMMQQQMIQQQQQQKQHSKITEVSKSKESSQVNGKQNQNNSASGAKKKPNYQQQDEDYEELNINVGQKLSEMKNQQQNFNMQEDEEGDEGEEDDEGMIIDLDKLDETNKQMLLEYLQEQYEKNPGQFPNPKEVEEQLKLYQQQKMRQDTESVRDIKSDEMVVEDTSQKQRMGIDAGENVIEQEGEGEDEEELTPEQQMQLQQLILQQQQMQQEQDYGEEQDDEQAQLEQLQMMQQQYQQQMMGKKPRAKGKGRPKSAGKRPQQKQVRSQQPQNDTQDNVLTPEQQQQLLMMLQQNQIDVENIDPNILQQLVVAQSQQQMAQSRPRTAKRKSSASKKKTKVMQKLMPYQMVPKNMKVLGPSTPGTHFKSFNTNRSTNQTLSKKKRKKSATKKQALTGMPSQQYVMPMVQSEQQPVQNIEMPMLTEEYLNQLSEEQLQMLLEHQQQLMMMQQQNQGSVYQKQLKKSSRPKSAKTMKSLKPKAPPVYSNYYQPYMNSRRKSNGKGKKKGKKSKKSLDPTLQEGVLMNNYFPALESGQLIGQSQNTEEGGSLSKDAKYPKFSHDIVNNPNLLAQQQDAIHEVPPEQEEGESQELVQGPPPNYGETDQDGEMDQMIQQDQDIQQDGMDQDQEGQDEVYDGGFEISDEQLIQLIQNAHNLSPEQQQQLQMILQERMKGEMMNDRAQSYQNIYHILMDNVQKAKDRLAGLAMPSGSIEHLENETDRRILRQKQEFEALYRQYEMEMKQKEYRKKYENDKVQKKLQREMKIQAIKEQKFQEEMNNHQKSLNYKRNAQQVRLCQKVYKLASELEKEKLLAEKKEYKETIVKKKQQSKLMVDALENFYKNMIGMLKDKIENERLERKIAQQAQSQAMARMKKELNQQKRQEVERYLQLLRQEDQRYDFESTNLQKIEQEILKLYKK